MNQDILAQAMGEWSQGVSWSAVLFKIALSMVFASIIGCERATNRHAAGLRTFILVAMVSTIAGLADEYILSVMNSNVSFISAATVIGIAILSSNTILFSSRNQLKGLTTSIALWVMSAIGVLIGFDMYIASIICFVAFLSCLALFAPIERLFKCRSDHFEVHLELKSKNSLLDFMTTVRQFGLKIDDIEVNPAYANSGLGVYSVSLTVVGKDLKKFKTHEEIIQVLSQLEYINHIEEL